VGNINYQKLSVLVADDFSSFRSTVSAMLLNLGVSDVGLASSGDQVIEKCETKSYDVILCDYDLGPERNGQHVLEELRHRDILTRQNIFIMVSAEASRNIVMSAYDCEPDDYLMKPITAMMLEQRMKRLLLQREVLKPVYQAFARDEMRAATDYLIDLSISENRYSSVAQKMLGELFIHEGELQKAEKLYTRALEVRPLDWARLGLARVKQLRGDLDTAGSWLEQIVDENPLYLPAYDILADNWDRKGESFSVQDTVARAVGVSPMSILRQKRLAKVADENEDITTAIVALQKTIKLGRFSCYGGPQDNFNFARTVSNALEKNIALPAGAVDEAIDVLRHARDSFNLSQEEIAQIHLLEGRVKANEHDVERARACWQVVEDIVAELEPDINFEVDRVELMFALHEDERAEALLVELKARFADDEGALQQLDKFLSEPISEVSRELVAEVNREGINLYTDGMFDEALCCFDRARKLFPKHVGIQLNIVQSIIGKLKLTPKDDALQGVCREALLSVGSLLDEQHDQYDRYRRLKKKADLFIS